MGAIRVPILPDKKLTLPRTASQDTENSQTASSGASSNASSKAASLNSTKSCLVTSNKDTSPLVKKDLQKARVKSGRLVASSSASSLDSVRLPPIPARAADFGLLRGSNSLSSLGPNVDSDSELSSGNSSASSGEENESVEVEQVEAPGVVESVAEPSGGDIKE